MSSAPAAPPRDEAARAAGRGVAFIGLAKIYFMIAGAAIEIGLKTIAGKYVYGAYGYVSSAVSTINNVVVTGTIQAVSRQVTADGGQADAAKATGFRLHLRLGLPLALLFAAAAPLWARYAAADADKTGPLMLAAAIIAGYSFYAVLVGAANGARQFHKQAGLDATFATLRALAILGAAAAGLGVWGAIGGWVAAVVAIFAVASTWVGLPKPGAAPAAPLTPMFTFLGGVSAYLIVTNLFLNADTFLLKPIAASWFKEHGADAALAAKEADGVLGLYRAVQLLARLPYQLMVAVTFVIFPLVSAATFDQDRARAAGYIGTTMRYSLIFAGAMGAVLAAHAGPILDIPFNEETVASGARALALLALGHVAFALFTIGGTILNGAGRTRAAVTGATITLVALVGSLAVVLPRADAGAPMLTAAAACTGGAMVAGALITGWQLHREFGVFLPVLTALRVFAATAAAWGVCRVVPEGGLVFALAGALAAGAVYLVVLVGSGELGRADLARVLAVARRKKP